MGRAAPLSFCHPSTPVITNPRIAERSSCEVSARDLEARFVGNTLKNNYVEIILLFSLPLVGRAGVGVAPAAVSMKEFFAMTTV